MSLFDWQPYRVKITANTKTARVQRAIIAGLTGVASDISGNRDIAKNQANDLLVPPADPEPFADALIQVLTNQTWWAGLAENAHITARRYS